MTQPCPVIHFAVRVTTAFQERQVRKVRGNVRVKIITMHEKGKVAEDNDDERNDNVPSPGPNSHPEHKIRVVI